jgi:cation diffusion facilitator CzcD-associated flavoprotein CzcO
MRSYADQFGLRKYIEFNTKVVDIVRDNETKKWVVTVESNGKRATRAFDKVIISHGMEHSPNVASFEGSERFKGTIMHSQGYKS